jgi:hypothetical protein
LFHKLIQEFYMSQPIISILLLILLAETVLQLV